MLIYRYIIFLLFIVLPTNVGAVTNIIDTGALKDNAFLLLGLLVAFCSGAWALISWYINKQEKKLEEAIKSEKESQSKINNQELAGRDTEIAGIKASNITNTSKISEVEIKFQNKINEMESKSSTCNTSLPLTYVTKDEFNNYKSDIKERLSKVKEELREDISNSAEKTEGKIKETKRDIKDDIETQIERIIQVLEAKLS